MKFLNYTQPNNFFEKKYRGKYKKVFRFWRQSFPPTRSRGQVSFSAQNLFLCRKTQLAVCTGKQFQSDGEALRYVEFLFDYWRYYK